MHLFRLASKATPLSAIVLFFLLPSALDASSLHRYYALRTASVAGTMPGGFIVVRTVSGEKVRGEFLERTADELKVRCKKGQIHRLRWSLVDWIRCRDKRLADLPPKPAKKLFTSRKSEPEDPAPQVVVHAPAPSAR